MKRSYWKRTRVTRAAVALLLVGALLAGCTGGGAGAPSGGAAPAKALDAVKIGFVGILTGPAAPNGEFGSRGAQLAVDEINAAGGVQVPGESGKRKLELVTEDDQAQPQVGINAIQKLIGTHKVFAFMGPDYSSITYPSLYLGEEAKVPQITSSLAPKITEEKKSSWIFRSRAHDGYNADTIVRYMVEDLKLKKIGLAYTNNEYGRTGIETAEKVLKEKFKLSPAEKVGFNVGDKDMTPAATKLMQAGSEGVIVWGTTIESALVLKSLQRLGYKGRFFYSQADEIFAALFTEQELNGVLGNLSWIPSDTNPRSQQFVKAFQAKYNKVPEVHAATYYDAVYLIKHGIEGAGLDRARFRDFLRKVKSFDGLQGRFHPADFDNGDTSTAVLMFEYQGKNPVLKKKYD